ncbi:hypothetical protein B0F90DRAFT_1799904 [Multifurca ochricompacta]|uniref:Uncharacterized protein n=1 Tax=Multifurca ochricompacta TaxID=376703 RepID=A0AAD4QIJ0_9AGAM|nr:hypothetical protein B0F90DRAFT_1799904 [Multifurca ochricompacta]
MGHICPKRHRMGVGGGVLRPRGLLLLFVLNCKYTLYPHSLHAIVAAHLLLSMSRINSSPPLDASGVLTWKLLNFLAGQRPSAQQELGNRWLDDARNLATENEALLSPGDLEIVREKITLTMEIKVGLESKKGLSKYFQAREYRKTANDAHRFVKTVSDRAKIAAFGQSSRVAGTHPVLIDPRAEVGRQSPFLYVHH